MTIAPLIAVVDDDGSLRRSMARVLKAAGFEPATFASAEDLLADQRLERFDMFIVDLQLGGMSGFELRERLSATGMSTPTIIMTARDERELFLSEHPTRGADMLRKSDPAERLLSMLRERLELPAAEGSR